LSFDEFAFRTCVPIGHGFSSTEHPAPGPLSDELVNPDLQYENDFFFLISRDGRGVLALDRIPTSEYCIAASFALSYNMGVNSACKWRMTRANDRRK
jgi:hypothetical protein